ncbi:MAG: magnesium transporter [Gammaproteobacteria bacterium]|nr:MAG: magnesium transporter [Gammaproteobacteria bacterium]
MSQTLEQEHNQNTTLKQIRHAIDEGLFLHVRQILSELSPADIADVLESVPPKVRDAVWQLIPESRQGDILNELAEEVRADILSEMQAAEVAAAIEGQDTDDIADILGELPEQLYHQVLAAMSEQDRQRVASVLDYPEDTAGGLMNTDTVTVRANVELEVVLRYLRMRGELPEKTDVLYVVDRNDHLLGALPLAFVVTKDPSTLVADCMVEAHAIPADMPASEVAHAFEKYDWLSAPVVNEQNQLLGRVTVDDVVDVIIEDADQSLMNMAGLDEDEHTFAPATETAKKRAVWLGINLVTAFMAAMVSNLFEDTLDKLAAVAVLMTIVPSMGGIAGSQTLTIVIRGMALGQISDANSRWLVIKELIVGLLNGLLWAAVTGIIVAFWKESLELGAIIAAAMFINLIVAAIVGALLPLAMKKFGIDPAVAGGVVLTTVTDVVGLFSFLALATWLLL